MHPVQSIRPLFHTFYIYVNASQFYFPPSYYQHYGPY